ncbi:hypothetical protein GCM10023195_32210 [Actinoallomurus liliacearum]|uniref:Secreted protein n=1 Tax=Actinoallomurus liliacearum TaxID=1080073 RepID=A0ABP8TL61_9ACTN
MKRLALSAATLLAAGVATATLTTAAHADTWVTVGGPYETISSCHEAGQAYAAKYHPQYWTCDGDYHTDFYLKVFE